MKICLQIWSTILPFIVLSGASDIRNTLMFFQAARTNGDIGFYNIRPDQFPIIESTITLPLFAFISNVLFPLCRCLKKALHKVILGGSLVGVSLVCAGLVSGIMERSYPDLPVAGQGVISIYNTLNCDVFVNSKELGLDNALVLSGELFNKTVGVRDCRNLSYKIISDCYNSSGQLKVCEGENISYFFQNYSLIEVSDAGDNRKGLARFR